MKEKLDEKYIELLTEAIGKARLASVETNTMILMQTHTQEELKAMRAAINDVIEAAEKAIALVQMEIG